MKIGRNRRVECHSLKNTKEYASLMSLIWNTKERACGKIRMV